MHGSYFNPTCTAKLCRPPLLHLHAFTCILPVCSQYGQPTWPFIMRAMSLHNKKPTSFAYSHGLLSLPSLGCLEPPLSETLACPLCTHQPHVHLATHEVHLPSPFVGEERSNVWPIKGPRNKLTRRKERPSEALRKNSRNRDHSP